MRLSEASALLAKAGIDSPLREARQLFSHFTGMGIHLLLGSDHETDIPEFEEAVRRRAERYPLQYIIGEVGFYREKYKVAPGCLIPREDTEILVDYAVKNLTRGATFLDLCTGSGCIAISVLSNTGDTVAIGADLSDKALEIAKENARLNGVSDRLRLVLADALADILCADESDPTRLYDAILSNPPYVTSSAYKSLEPELYHEPKMALVGGEDGLDFYRSITARYKNLIKKEGFIAYEIGFDQADGLRTIAEKNNMTAEILTDLSSNPRVAVLRRKSV